MSDTESDSSAQESSEDEAESKTTTVKSKHDSDDSSTDSDDDDEIEEEEDTSDSDTSESEEEDNVDVDVVLQDNVVVNASLDAAKRKSHTHVHSAPTGNYAAFRIPGDIFSLGNKAPWDVVNPMGVHPKDAEKSIFSYDISSLPETEEARPWRAAGADMSDWFNYGFNENTWEKYRKKMLKVIKNESYEQKISVLSEQTRQSSKR